MTRTCARRPHRRTRRRAAVAIRSARWSAVGTPARVRGPRAGSGDDTRAVLRELGYDEESVGVLRKAANT
jgi:crotonobetainyl-CoA:carnitine CoA-transferase CaiB-like acyl-CoA transferase